MRVKKPHWHHLRIASLALMGLLMVMSFGCRKRDDGLVFDDSNVASKGRTSSRPMMYGRVVDRNDRALKRVTILVSPGNGELISNKWGEYEIDRLYNEDGTPRDLERGREYTINAWKPGFHETTQIFRYEGGVQEIPTITLIEDHIKLETEVSPMIPVETLDDLGGGAVGRSHENE